MTVTEELNTYKKILEQSNSLLLKLDEINMKLKNFKATTGIVSVDLEKMIADTDTSCIVMDPVAIKDTIKKAESLMETLQII